MRVDEARRRMGRGQEGAFAEAAASIVGQPVASGFQASSVPSGGAAGASSVPSGGAAGGISAGLPALSGSEEELPALRQWKAQAEEAYVRRVWAVSGGDVRKAATRAGISRGHWYELMKKCGL
jgi:two-component system NtrC family response regulator